MAAHVVHLATVLWVFREILFEGRVLYFRDISLTYYPDYVFAARWLAQGLWPLWNPHHDAGAPFLMAYPVQLLLLALAGARATLAVSPPLHVLLAMSGLTVLARRLGVGGLGSWAAGSVYGLSGLMLSSLLFPNFLAAAWAPWVLSAFRALLEAPSARKAGLLGALLAVEASTFGAEVLLQTGLAALFLFPRRPCRRALGGLGGAVALSSLLAAPVLLGSRSLLEGSARGRGFPPEHALAYSASVPVLIESVLPKFFGDVHTFTDLGYWGQPFFPEGSPYFLSLYLGPGVWLLALLARTGALRLWGMAGLGILLSLGSHTALGPLLIAPLTVLRGPVKFFFLSTVALSLLAGRGLDRRSAGGPLRLWAPLPGLAFLMAGAGVAWHPEAPARLLGPALPQIRQAQAQEVARTVWPRELLTTGALCLGAGAAVAGGPLTLPLAPVLVVLDLLRLNSRLNPATEAAFYELRPAMRALVAQAEAAGRHRWFSYGVANSPPLHWDPAIVGRNSDVWLFYLDRQALLPRTHVLDGLEAAYDLDRMGWAPEGSTLSVRERTPALFRQHHGRLRLAGVRWVLSFQPLPSDLTAERGHCLFPEVREPLRLYELREPLPRILHVSDFLVAPDRPSLDDRLHTGAFDPLRTVLLERAPAPSPAPSHIPGASVRYERPDPHTVRVHAEGAPGLLVLLEGHHRDWRLRGPEGAVPLLRANGRYWAWTTPGGSRLYEASYAPAWLRPSLALLVLGLGAAVLMVTRPASNT